MWNPAGICQIWFHWTQGKSYGSQQKKILCTLSRCLTTAFEHSSLDSLSPWDFPKKLINVILPLKRSGERRQYLQNWTRLEIFLVHSLRLAYFQYFCITEILKFALELIQRARLGSECSHYLFFHYLHYLQLTRKENEAVLTLSGFLFQILLWVTLRFLGMEDDYYYVVS